MQEEEPTTAIGAEPSLVRAKLHPPRPSSGLVRRSSLIERLTEGHDRQITLVVAPAGFGKSTLLTQWMAADPMRRFCWVSLEPEDNDPVTLLRYIVLALESHVPSLGTAWAMLDRAQPDPKAVVAEITNHLFDVPGRVVLVLDDYHAITDTDAHRTIQYLLDHLPHSTQLALSTRLRPPLALSTFEAAGMVMEVGREDLRFSQEETERAVASSDYRIGSEDPLTIHERTEGWPVAVYLSAHRRDAAALNPGANNVEAIYRYLEEQVLDELPHDDRRTLAEWSILRSLSGDVCDHVSGRNDSGEMLVRLARSNRLVIPMDDDDRSFRFHDLMREALGQDFGRRSEGDRQGAHLRASEWFVGRGYIREGVGHAVDAGAYQRAGELIGEHWYDIFMLGGGATLRGWFSRFPPSAFTDYPPMLIPAAWTTAFSGDVDETLRYSTEARRATYEGPMPDGSASYASGLAMLNAGLGHHGMAQANADAEKAIGLEPADSPWRGLACAMAGVTRFGIGDFVRARAAFRESIESAPSQADTLYARGQLALLESEQRNWAEAQRHAEIACEAIEELDMGDILASWPAQAAAAVIAANDGQHGLAKEKLRALAPVMAKVSDAIPFDAFQIHLVAAETYLAIGESGAAAIHTDASTKHLAAFGDAGIFEARHSAVLAALEGADETPEIVGEAEIDLTDRELEVLALLPSESSLREIGEQLYVSRNTAKTHLTNVYRKLGVSDRTTAVTRARELGLI